MLLRSPTIRRDAVANNLAEAALSGFGKLNSGIFFSRGGCAFLQGFLRNVEGRLRLLIVTFWSLVGKEIVNKWHPIASEKNAPHFSEVIFFARVFWARTDSPVIIQESLF
jgi:hypothetical protein